MGRWNRRRYHIPRKRRNYEYEDPPPSPPDYHFDSSSYVGENSVPSWEMDFCTLMRVPWKKVVIAKRYMYCHESVVKWDDSAAEEAFYNAKKRYWAEINALPFENPPPGPDLYIDEIDWNADIDPYLVSDLDQEYFNPDEAEIVDKSEATHQETKDSNPGIVLIRENQNTWNGDNPWESNSSRNTQTWKDNGQSWNLWNDSTNVAYVDKSWERNWRVGQSSKNNEWAGGEESWGWSRGQVNVQSVCHPSRCDTIWNHSHQTVRHARGNEWRNADNNPLVQSNTNGQKSWNSFDKGKPWGSALPPSNEASENGGWSQNRSKKWGFEEVEYQKYGSSHLEPRRLSATARPFYNGRRKREESFQHMPICKISRFQGDERGNRRQWRRQIT